MLGQEIADKIGEMTKYLMDWDDLSEHKRKDPFVMQRYTDRAAKAVRTGVPLPDPHIREAILWLRQVVALRAFERDENPSADDDAYNGLDQDMRDVIIKELYKIPNAIKGA